jgi:hypothetical protein
MSEKWAEISRIIGVCQEIWIQLNSFPHILLHLSFFVSDTTVCIQAFMARERCCPHCRRLFVPDHAEGMTLICGRKECWLAINGQPDLNRLKKNVDDTCFASRKYA